MDLELLLVEEELAICRLDPAEPVPKWATERTGLSAVVRTADELSVVCDEGRVPDGIEASGAWRALRVAGALDLSLTGVLIALLAPLERAGIPIFAISTFDTDYVLIPGGRCDEAVAVLESAGHTIR